MNRLMQDLGLTDLESRYMDEMQKIQQRMSEITAESDVNEKDVMVPLADVKETDGSIVVSMDLPGVDKKDVEIPVTDDEPGSVQSARLRQRSREGLPQARTRALRGSSAQSRCRGGKRRRGQGQACRWCTGGYPSFPKSWSPPGNE